MNTTDNTQPIMKTITIAGQTFEVPVDEAAKLARTLGTDSDVKVAKKELTKDQMKEKRIAEYQKKRAELIAANKDNPEWIAKQEKKDLNKQKRDLAKKNAVVNKQNRQQRLAAEADRISALITEAGSKLPISRILKCGVQPYHAVGALRGYKSVLVYTEVNGAKVSKHNLFNLDVIGNGTTQDMLEKANADLLSLLKTSK